MTDIFDILNIEDLPPELIKELKLSGDIDNKILMLFAEGGGVLSLTKLLVGYFRRYKETKTRQYMMTTCYRLTQKNFLQATEKKGEYKITDRGRAIISEKIEEISEQEIEV